MDVVDIMGLFPEEDEGPAWGVVKDLWQDWAKALPPAGRARGQDHAPAWAVHSMFLQGCRKQEAVSIHPVSTLRNCFSG